MIRICWCILLICPLFTDASTMQDGFHYRIVKNAVYPKAAVSSAHPLASRAGMMVMKEGGNAFDAAVATQLALAVVYPGAGNLGGGGLMLARKANGEMIALEYRECAPQAAHEDMYLDSSGKVKDRLSTTGRLASGVPGTVAGLFATLPYCKLSFEKLAQPAIALAAAGFAITASEARSLNEHRQEFVDNNASPIAFVKSDPWKGGDTLRQPELAETLRRLARGGQDDFYKGKTADLIVAEMRRGNGIITRPDLAGYAAKHRKPVNFSYRGFDVFSFPPPSSGGILLAQMLKMTERFPIASYGFQTAKSVHLMTEIERRAYADRATHLGDPDFYHVPQKTLLSDAYLRKRMADFDPSRAGSSDAVVAGEIPESSETTHLSVADSDGNCVSVTTTLNGSYGCKTVVTGAGFFLNNEMDDFSVKPGAPNMYGALGGKANAIAPGKRMLSSMAPTIVLHKKKPYLILGTPGGTTIPTSVYQTIVNIVDFHMTVSDAVNKAKFHHQWRPDVIELETGFDPKVADELKAMGHSVTETSSLGRMELIEFNGTAMSVCADGRGDDSTDGF